MEKCPSCGSVCISARHRLAFSVFHPGRFQCSECSAWLCYESTAQSARVAQWPRHNPWLAAVAGPLIIYLGVFVFGGALAASLKVASVAGGKGATWALLM